MKQQVSDGHIKLFKTSSNKMLKQEKTEIFEIASTGTQAVKTTKVNSMLLLF